MICGGTATDLKKRILIPLMLRKGLAFNATTKYNQTDIFETSLKVNYTSGRNFTIQSQACV